MSNKKENSQSSASKKDQLADLSSLNFAPAWAREKQRAPKPRRNNGGKKKYNDEAGGKEQQGKRHSDRPYAKKQGRERRDSRRPRRDFTPVAPPEGLVARIMPIEEGMDAMAKQIRDTGRTHSVFDLAWLVLGGLDRFHVIFEREDATPLHRNKTDESVWYTQAECLAQMWSAKLYEKYYDTKLVEVDAPAGNFTSVARCGVSGELIGPPNHHAYQQNVINRHGEQGASISLEQYKSRIKVETTQESIDEWLEGMKQSTQWTPKVVSAEPTETAASGDESEQKEVEKVEEVADSVALTSRQDLEKHFTEHLFDQEFETARVISAKANINGKNISPGMLTLLKQVVAEEKRYPGKLASILCRQMSGRHLAVFKWKKRLHCGPSRPKKLVEDVVMAERPTVLFQWVVKNPSGNIDVMWKDCLPKDIDEEVKKLWYHDLHWLINEGHILFFSDGKLNSAKEVAEPK